MRVVRLSVAVTLFAVLLLPPISADQRHVPAGYTHFCTLLAEPHNAFTHVRAPMFAERDPLDFSAVPTPVNVTYNGFTPQAQAAFQHAVDIWANLISSSVTINVTANYVALGPNVLGSAGAKYLWRDASGFVPDTWYGDALGDKLSGSDLYVGEIDIVANFNNAFNWYLGTNGVPGGGQYDFVSVVLHELGHGMNFFGLPNLSAGVGTLGLNGFPSIYDRFTVDSNNTPLLNLNGATLGGLLVQPYNPAAPNGPGIYWGGAHGVVGNSGIAPRLFTQSSWAPGSSYSHLDDNVFVSGNPNSLMTHALAAAEAIHNPGPIALGMLEDMGWTIQSPVPPLPDFRDFNADGQPDLVYENLTTGGRYVWFMNGASFSSGSFISPNPIDSTLSIAGVNDFTGDGKPDLLMQSATNNTATLVRLDGVTSTGTQVIQSVLNTPWKVVATGDFNADGKPDIVWENFSAGQIYIWFMASSGGLATYAGPGGAFAGNYIRDGASNIISLGATTNRVVGAADIDLDGDHDLVLQDQATGALTIWYLNGHVRTATQAVSPGTVNVNWKIKAVGDYNNNGRADFIFQHTNGALYIWFMNGGSLVTGSYLTPSAVNPVWQMAGPR
jgi:hypothetical protein